jgi:hypothetical protein
MQPLSQRRLAGNAFRTLGISGSADQTAIDNAARRMRIFPSPDAIPPTPWDMPAFGPIPRKSSDIEQAVAALYDPATRAEERLLWFVGDMPPQRGAGFDTNTVEGRHNRAVMELHNHMPLSHDAFRRIDAHAAAPDTLPWLMAIERAGEFEKTASPEEIAAALAALPAACAAEVVTDARHALERSDLETYRAAVALLQQAQSPAAREQAPRILDALEDVIDARCQAFDKQLRDVLRTNSQNPHPFFAANVRVTSDVANAYESTVAPFLRQLPDLAGQDSERVARVLARCGQLVRLIGLGWEWSGRFVTSEETYKIALTMVAGSLTEPQVQDDLARVGPLAAHARQIAARAAAQREANAEAVRRATHLHTTIGAGGAPYVPPHGTRVWKIVGLTVAGFAAAVVLLNVLLVGVAVFWTAHAPRLSAPVAAKRSAPPRPAPARPRDAYDAVSGVNPIAVQPGDGSAFAETTREP